MSYAGKIKEVQKDLVDDFIKDLYVIRELVKQSIDKEDLMDKLLENDMIYTTSYYYIKYDKFEDIEPKLNKLLD